jgi:putative transposase
VIDAAVGELIPVVGARAACRALGVAQATHYRRHRRSPAPPPPPRPARKPQPRALSTQERQRILEVLHSPRFCDVAPAEVWATLLDEGVYLASVSTMYRVLREAGELSERRAQATHPPRVRPELCATAPNQAWSWDITKLHGPQKWSYFYLYAIIDIFSRYVVGWMLATTESSELARTLIEQTCASQGVDADTLVLHADRGSSMASKPVAFLLADLGVTKSHSRPHVPNDNPYSESQFKTLKYRPGYPRSFATIEEARAWCRDFFAWYNLEHRHSGLGLLTPADVHHGRVDQVRRTRAGVLADAYATHPERFIRKPPVPPAVPATSWINKPQETKETAQ